MHVHVFAIDLLPAPGLVTAGGGLRSRQIVEGLRARGFEVTVSIPAATDLARSQWDKLADADRALAVSDERGRTYEDLIARLRPDAVVCLWPILFSFPRPHRDGPVVVHDANGLQNVEIALAGLANGAVGDTPAGVTRRYLDALATGDILLAGSPEQKGYWQGLLALRGDTLDPPGMIVLPYHPPDLPADRSYEAGGPTFFCTGSFLPWNSPEGHLLRTARLIEEAGRGRLVVVGRPGAGMAHAGGVGAELRALEGFPFVEVRDGLPYPDLSALMNGRGVAVDLNARTLERELAVPIRTVTYLAHGVPILTNGYADLGRAVAASGAGWAVDGSDPEAFDAAVRRIIATPDPALAAMSDAARRLARDRFAPDDGFDALGRRLEEACAARARPAGGRPEGAPTAELERPPPAPPREGFGIHPSSAALVKSADALPSLLRGGPSGREASDRGGGRAEGTAGALSCSTPTSARPSGDSVLPARRRMGARDPRPCVLVISDAYENLLELRVRIPFDAMVRTGLIGGYHLLSHGRIVRSVGDAAERGRIDVVWVQRIPSRNPLFIAEGLADRFVYDIDDNLLVTPSYRPAFGADHLTLVRTLLGASRAVATTGPRLMRSLERHAGFRIGHKTIVAPNLSEAVHRPERGAAPEALLLAGSDHLPLTRSRDAFFEAVRRFGERRGLPLVYVGTEVNDLSGIGLPVRTIGMLGYGAYLDFLRRHDVLAVVPLEGRGDPRTQEFVDGKSDVKMVEFGSCGVPAVYADVPPYRDTLLHAGPLVDMGDPDALLAALDDGYGRAATIREMARESVERDRLADAAVADTWFAAVDAGRLSAPLALDALLEREAAFARLTRETPVAEELFDAAAYRSRNPGAVPPTGEAEADCAAAYRHYREVGIGEGRGWFPLQVPNAQDLMLRVREQIAAEGEALRSLEGRVDDAVARPPPPAAASGDLAGPPGKRAVGALLSLWPWRRRPRAPALFDPEFYLATYPDVRATGRDPYRHFLEHGIREGRNPNAVFDTAWYVASNPGAGADPLRHYLEVGAAAGADPGPGFSTRGYLRRYPDVAGMNPLVHFLLHGRAEGREPKPWSLE